MAKLCNGAWQSTIYDFSFDFLRLLDRVLAGIHNSSNLHTRLRELQDRHRIVTGHRAAESNRAAIIVEFFDEKSCSLQSHHPRHVGVCAGVVDHDCASHAGDGDRYALCSLDRRNHPIAAILRIHLAVGACGPAGNVYGICIFADRYWFADRWAARRSTTSPVWRSTAPATKNLVDGERDWRAHRAVALCLRPHRETGRGLGYVITTFSKCLFDSRK